MPQYRQGTFHGEGLHFAIIASRFNDTFVARLLEGALDCLGRHGVSETAIDVVRVPGSWEIPVTAQRLARGGRYQAIL